MTVWRLLKPPKPIETFAEFARGYRDPFDITAELLGDDLRDHGLRALAHGRSAGRDLDLARGGDADLYLLVRTATGRLDEVGHADSEIATVTACKLLAGWKVVPPGSCQRIGLARGIVTGIEDDRQASARHKAFLERHLVGLNEIAAADLGAIDIQCLSRAVEQTFHDEHALRLARATNRSHRHLVSERGRHLHAEGGDYISERKCSDGALWNGETAGCVGTMIMQQRATYSEDLAFAVKCDFGIPVLVALLRCRDKVLASVFNPANRTSGCQRRNRDGSFFGIKD